MGLCRCDGAQGRSVGTGVLEEGGGALVGHGRDMGKEEEGLQSKRGGRGEDICEQAKNIREGQLMG